MTKEKFKEVVSKIDESKTRLVEEYIKNHDQITLDISNVKKEFQKTFKLIEKGQNQMNEGFDKAGEQISHIN